MIHALESALASLNREKPKSYRGKPAIYYRRRRQRRLAADKCPDCGKDTSKSRWKLCLRCRKRARARMFKYLNKESRHASP